MTRHHHRHHRGLFEHRTEPPLSPREFRFRLGKFAGLAVGIVVVFLGLGMLGYHEFEGLGWIDAFLNASMILGGMGPVNPLVTDAGKLFAGTYALFAGLVFLVSVGLIFGPLIHRLLHRFHFDDEQGA